MLKAAVLLATVAGLMLLLLLAGPGHHLGVKEWLAQAKPTPVSGGAASRVKFHGPSEEAPFSPEAFCAPCHPTPPHQKSPRLKAILNHHVARLHCLICHGGQFISFPGEIGRNGNVLWPQVGGQWLDPQREKLWRDQVTATKPCFPVGPGCQECHRPERATDLLRLGYDRQTANRLVNLEEFFLKPPPDKWFFPQLF